MIIEGILLGSILASSLYHVLIYIGRRQDKGNLFHCFFYLSMGLIVFIKYIFPHLPFYSVQLEKIAYCIAAYIISTNAMLFTAKIFEIDRMYQQDYKIFICICMVGIGLGAGFLITYIFISNRIFYSISFIPLIAFSIYVVLYFFYHILFTRRFHKRKQMITFYGLVLFMLIAIIKIVMDQILNITISELILKIVTFSQYFYLLFLITLAITDSNNEDFHTLIKLQNSLEQEVIKRTQSLTDAQYAKNMFFINLAHETKTPLTLIANYLEAYEKKYKSNEDFQVIKRNILKIQRDIIHFMDYEKLERGQIFYNHDQAADFSGLLADKIRLFKEYAAKMDIHLEAAIGNKIGARIDPYALDRIINNLVENAIKYNRVGGRIKVDLSVQEEQACLEVFNTGDTIEEEHLKDIFKPYTQLTHKKRNTQGLGMGLAIVYQIVTDAKGSITVSSSPEEGTLFRGLLPFADAEACEEILAAPPQPFWERTPKTESMEQDADLSKLVLVVEDNADMNSYLVSQLSRYYQVYSAFNGKEALMRITEKGRKPDLILSDIVMSEMDGYQMLEHLYSTEDNKNIPVIFITANEKDHARLKALTTGAIDFIPKPFLMGELLMKVRSILAFSEKLRNAEKSFIISKVLDAIKTEAPAESKSAIMEAKLENKFMQYGFSKREQDIIQCVFMGLQNKEISTKLALSTRTVDSHLYNIFKKAQCQNRSELIMMFYN